MFVLIQRTNVSPPQRTPVWPRSAGRQSAKGRAVVQLGLAATQIFDDRLAACYFVNTLCIRSRLLQE
jgi:hypothetical protein